MYDENDLIYSPLQQTFMQNGKSVEIHIYRMPDSGWSLEVVDEHNNSTVWDDEFVTDKDALKFCLEEIDADGIDAFSGPPSSSKNH